MNQLTTLSEHTTGLPLVTWLDRARALIGLAFPVWNPAAEATALRLLPGKFSEGLFASWSALSPADRPTSLPALLAWVRANNELYVVDHGQRTLEELVSGGMQQGSDSVAVYTQRFHRAWTHTGSFI